MQRFRYPDYAETDKEKKYWKGITLRGSKRGLEYTQVKRFKSTPEGYRWVVRKEWWHERWTDRIGMEDKNVKVVERWNEVNGMPWPNKEDKGLEVNGETIWVSMEDLERIFVLWHAMYRDAHTEE
ncbi:hypothetical protein NP233_g8520 [Leucocoprinus birnbaumii]|uniref:Uncharacterized protein n=1 Tax=Leucocoprinus birnbaumii TaxID=56174 RepID=A0AAD5VM63_9AGAR|nr:hypothetical protein NP233_g8520 [Leucocoprinus birnbaumii]